MDVVVEWIERTPAGDIASVLGLLVAPIGFAITIWNVRFFNVVAGTSTAIAALEKDPEPASSLI